MKKSSLFQRGSGVYTCRCCNRNTRATGRGDNDLVSMCAECYDLAGEENHLSDHGEFYSTPLDVLNMIKRITDKGGDASSWDALKAEAEHRL